MMYCPRCRGIMVPIRGRSSKGKAILKCRNCGYEMEASPDVLKEYRAREGVSDEAKVLTTKTIGKPLQRRVSKEELEQAKEDYYELVLDQMGEYGE